METDVMPFELSNVSVKDIDLEKDTIIIRDFKGHSLRAFKLKDEKKGEWN
jgi:hypothetical protein